MENLNLTKGRLTREDYFLSIAQLVSQRGTCIRRKVGCVLVDERNKILATGYNGVASKQPHCVDSPCPGANFKSTKGLDECQAVHAEQNAILQCADVRQVHKIYCTDSPCMSCTKLLLNTLCETIVYIRLYDAKALSFWIKAGKKTLHRISS